MTLLIFAFIFRIDCLVAVCQPLIKLLLTYLLTYLHTYYDDDGMRFTECDSSYARYFGSSLPKVIEYERRPMPDRKCQ